MKVDSPDSFVSNFNTSFDYGVNTEEDIANFGNQQKINFHTVPVSRSVVQPINIFTKYPILVTCPFCRQVVHTKPITKVGTTAWSAAFVLSLVGCCLGCCFLPFCINDFKDVYHVCPNCSCTIDVFKKL